MVLNMEIWKKLNSDYPGAYEVSDHGRIRNKWGKVLRPYAGVYGHLHVALRGGGRLTYKTLHRLICEAFHGNPPTPGHHAAHKDGNPQNNFPENLYWATAAENIADRDRHGRTHRGEKHWTKRRPDILQFGEDHPKVKLTDAQVQFIRTTDWYRGRATELAAEFNVSQSLIRKIRNGKMRNHPALL
jgi:hypothetical protein